MEVCGQTAPHDAQVGTYTCPPHTHTHTRTHAQTHVGTHTHTRTHTYTLGKHTHIYTHYIINYVFLQRILGTVVISNLYYWQHNYCDNYKINITLLAHISISNVSLYVSLCCAKYRNYIISYAADLQGAFGLHRG